MELFEIFLWFLLFLIAIEMFGMVTGKIKLIEPIMDIGLTHNHLYQPTANHETIGNE